MQYYKEMITDVLNAAIKNGDNGHLTRGNDMILTQDLLLEQLEKNRQYTALEITNKIFNTDQKYCTNTSQYQSIRAMLKRLQKHKVLEKFYDNINKEVLWIKS